MADTRRIAVATFGRSDFSILQPLCRLLNSDPDFDIGMWVGGAHFEMTSGRTLSAVKESGLPIWARIEAPPASRTEIGTVISMANQMTGFGRAASKIFSANAEVDVTSTGPQPDLVIILGDRYEAIAAGLAMVPLGIPVAHISGGSVTEGAFDDTFRHCLTKIAAIHFCDMPLFARRIHAMGEQPDRIITSGALGLDAFSSVPTNSLQAFNDHFNLNVPRGFALATLHPETRFPRETRSMAEAMVSALIQSGRETVITYPNSDPNSDQIIDVIEAAAHEYDQIRTIRSFGADWYPTAMTHAGFMIGNSSSGIIEAASFGLPVIDIGQRQKGRDHGNNVVHCERDRDAITAAIDCVTTAGFQRGSMDDNIYGDGRASQRIVAALRDANFAELAQPKIFADFDPHFSGELMEI